MAINHTFAGCQFPTERMEGNGIKSLIEEVERQRASRWDPVVNTKRLEFKVVDNQMVLKIDAPQHGIELVPVTKHVHQQIANYVGIRMNDRLYKWLSQGSSTPGQKGAPPTQSNWQTWANLYNDYLHTAAETRMVRCMKNADGTLYARAFVSDRYEVVPNPDFFYSIFDTLKEVGAEVWHARMSEDKFYIYAVAPGIASQVSLDRTFDPGDGWQSRWYGKEGDVVNAAFCGSNSETGEGGVSAAQAILRRVCCNYNVWQDVVSKAHIGKRHVADQFLSDETLKLRNGYFFGQLRDIVKATFNQEKFQALVDQMNTATKDVVADADKAVDVLQAVYSIDEDRKKAIRASFLTSHDFSRFGLANAITAVAHTKEVDPQVGYDMERLGTELMGNLTWAKLEKSAEKLLKEKEALVA